MNRTQKNISPTQSILDVCHERVDAGPCDQWQTRYYYNQDARRCEPFTYGGCQGNGNRFNSESECQSICITHEEPTNNQNKGKMQRISSGLLDFCIFFFIFFFVFLYPPVAVCTLPVLVGKCLDSQEYHKRWYYDDSRGNCVSFIYSGCAGNQNNFRSFESCTEYCGNRKSSTNFLFVPNKIQWLFALFIKQIFGVENLALNPFAFRLKLFHNSSTKLV